MIHAAPFRPFILRTASGEAFEIKHPDLIAFSPTDAEIIVFDAGGGFHILAADLIIEANVRPKRRTKSRST